MVNVLPWLRGQARLTDTEMMVVTPDESVESECPPGTYRIERFRFKGAIWLREARAIRSSDLIKTDTEHEMVQFLGPQGGGRVTCVYYRSTYTLVTE